MVKRVERAKLDERSYRTLFHSGRDAVFVHGISREGLPGQFLEVNDVACQLLGYTREQLLTLRPSDVVLAGQEADFALLVSRAMSGISVLFEKDLITRTGDQIPVEIHAHCFDLEGVPTFLSIARDIRARKMVEQALRDSEIRFRTLAEASSEGVCIHEKGILLEVNERFAEMFGYNSEELIGMSVLDLAAPEFREIVSRNVRAGTESRYEAVGLRKDGSRFNGELGGKAIPYKGRLVRVTTLLDITERKQAESLQFAVYRISEAAHDAESLDDLYSCIHGIVGELMPATNFYIALYDSSAEIVSFPYFVDEHDPPPAARKGARGLTEYVLRTGAPLLAPSDVSAELEGKGEADLIGTAQVDWLGVPLKTRENTIGVLVVQSYTQGIRFGHRESKILSFVSNQIAMAIERKRAEDEQRSAEERYRAFVQQSSEGIWRVEMEDPIPCNLTEDEQIALCYERGYLAECNDAMARMYGLSRAEEMVGMRLRDLMVPSDPHNTEYIKAFIRQGYRMTDAESHEVDKDGNARCFLNNLVGIIIDGRIVRAWGSQRDVTESKKASEAVRASEERYRLLFERNLAGVFRTTLDGSIIDCNDSFARILGYESREELQGIPAWNLYPERADRADFLSRLRRQQSITNFEIPLRRKDGSIIWALENVSLVPAESGEFLVEGTLVDITDRKKAEEQVAFQAYHDQLTGLPNRSLLRDRLDQSLARAQRLGRGLTILFLDLDHFKLINDTLGHSAGDWLLKEVAEALRKSVREVDTVARLGGDEFILLLPEVARGEDAARVAQKILDVVSAPLNHDGHELYLTTSIGISLSPADGQDSETLIRCADNAMYRAKELGRNNYQFSSDALNARARTRLAWEQNMRRAIEHKEFVLHYQPQYYLDSGMISGVEALIRWNHPEKGLILPEQFIRIAEESRLILQIGEWCLRTSFRQLKEWQQLGCRRLRLSMNLSGRQFQHRSLLDLLNEVVAETQVDPSSVMLEITESIAMQHGDHTLSILNSLKEKGFKIALDDFGIGYSSLSYLKHFPIDVIKIDPSFVKDLGRGHQEDALVRTIIYLGHSMNRTLIAEGVETEAQHTFLKFEGCEEVQGFLMSRPQEPAHLLPLLRP